MPQIVDSPLNIPLSIHDRILRLLGEATQLDSTHMGTMQVYDEKTEMLYLFAQQGFSKEFVQFFSKVKAFDPSSCGRALGIGGPVIINDTYKDIAFASLRKITDKEGIRAVKSVPIYSKEKIKLGVISTHFNQPKDHWDLLSLNDITRELSEVMASIRAANANGQTAKLATKR